MLTIRICRSANHRMLPTVVVGICASMLLFGCHAEAVRELTIQDLAEYETIPVTIDGRVLETYMTGDTCFYTEWAYGQMDEKMMVHDLEPAYQSADTIGVVTPYGVVKADVFTLRLYLGAYYSRTFAAENASIAPLPIQKLVEEKGGTIAVREYILAPDRTYYARVRYDTAYRDSDDPGVSEEIVKARLEVSDIPFSHASPDRQPTPAYRD